MPVDSFLAVERDCVLQYSTTRTVYPTGTGAVLHFFLSALLLLHVTLVTTSCGKMNNRKMPPIATRAAKAIGASTFISATSARRRRLVSVSAKIDDENGSALMETSTEASSSRPSNPLESSIHVTTSRTPTRRLSENFSSSINSSVETVRAMLRNVSQRVESAVAFEAHHLPVVKCTDTAHHRVSTPKSFEADALITARWLLGARLVRVLPCGTRLSGKIVEVEAYLGPHDKGAHSYGGKRTPRLEPMFAAGGVAYIYHMHACSCLNVIASKEGDPVGVLIRALEPVEGTSIMLQNRLRARALRGKNKTNRGPIPHVADMNASEREKLLAELCAGPGRLCHALAVDHLMSGSDLVGGAQLFLERGEHVPASQLVVSPRIGIEYAGLWKEAPLRFSVLGNRHVSKPWPRAQDKKMRKRKKIS
ncbi:3-methyladenine dna glycosylase [Nannochloropsis gaditana]|uniref:DNA-3-methyladenine glycosylase II n=1 Tax=Nannochloropsis gaditana TaxID=72520 RepID=W7U3Z9_9STRA|nr:3-methyladenine dna glycosylase [Nannochloropsis gaditana]